MSETKIDTELEANLDLLLKMMDESFDWEAWWEEESDDLRDVLKRVAKWHDYRNGNRPIGTVSCGGHRFNDTPKALYRTLYLFGPAEVDFSYMYKTGTMIQVCSPCYRFCASLELHKYEFAAYFDCAKEFAIGQSKMIQAGDASSDNGIKCNSDLGNKWFDMIVKILEHKIMVYSGNSFEV